MKTVTELEVLRLSKWVRRYERDGILALYHVLNIDVLYLDAGLGELVSSFQYGTTLEHLCTTYPQYADQLSELIDVLVGQGMVVGFVEDDEALFTEKKHQAVLPVGMETMYLLLTDACNLRCSYCFMLDGMPEDYRHSSMNWETAKVAVDMFFENVRRNPPEYKRSMKVINFYGGEPLINFRVIRKVVEYVEKTYVAEMEATGENFIFSMVTNGTLIDEEIAAYLAAHPKISLTLSLDGLEWVNDRMRIYKDGSGTFADVIRGLRLLKAAGRKSISLSCTLDQHNIDHLDQLLELHREFGFLSVNLNPLLDTGKSQVSSEYMATMNDRMIQYFKKARALGLYEDRMMRKVRPFISKRIHAFDCQATGHQIVCSPDGKLGVCHEGIGMKNYFFAPASSDFDFHGHAVIREWGARTPLNMPQCHDCSAIGICGGGCAYGAQLRNGSIWSMDDRFCLHSLATLEWIIWDIYAQSV
jgi:uncharacterized protein